MYSGQSILGRPIQANSLFLPGRAPRAPAPVGLPLFNNLVEMIKNDVDPGGFLRDRRCKLDRENNETIFYGDA